MSFVLSSAKVPDAEMQGYLALLKGASWRRPHGRNYETADVTAHLKGCARAVFLKIPPGGNVHKHVDVGDCKTDHIVISTNKGCRNYWTKDGEQWAHMKAGFRYSVDRTLEHWAVNEGKTDRVHLLVEY